jgi:hypothetical protein
MSWLGQIRTQVETSWLTFSVPHIKPRHNTLLRGRHCGDIELVTYLTNATDPVPLVVDLNIDHDRFGSSSDPSLNGHLHYPNDIDPPNVVSLCLLLLVRLGGYIVNSLDCYSYRIIGKLTQTSPSPVRCPRDRSHRQDPICESSVSDPCKGFPPKTSKRPHVDVIKNTSDESSCHCTGTTTVVHSNQNVTYVIRESS